jgi:antitoxin YefM
MPKIDRRRKSATNHVSYTDFRERLAAYMEQVSDSRAPLHVTRQGGRAVVVVSEEEFDGWMETLHLLRSPANARRLLAAMGSANAGKVRERSLIEPEE